MSALPAGADNERKDQKWPLRARSGNPLQDIQPFDPLAYPHRQPCRRLDQTRRHHEAAPSASRADQRRRRRGASHDPAARARRLRMGVSGRRGRQAASGHQAVLGRRAGESRTARRPHPRSSPHLRVAAGFRRDDAADDRQSPRPHAGSDHPALRPLAR